MKSGFPRNCWHAMAPIVIVMFAVAGCAPSPSQKMVRADAVLTKVGKFAEDSFYSCLLNGYTQGLSPAQARDECATQLLADDQKGFGGSIGDIQAGKASFFDPSKITAACNSGDPTRGQSSGQRNTPGWGTNTWGRNAEMSSGSGTVSKGLTKEQSEKLKVEAIEAAKTEWKEYNKIAMEELAAEKALEAAKKTGDQQQIQKAQKDLDDAKKATADQVKKALDTSEKATKDPNAGGTVRTAGEPSACDQALEGARELLRECHRTQWKDFRCQQLQARMSGCPDPVLILVDPDQGYSCGAKVNPEAVKDAWVAKCEQRVKFGPDGPNPCKPPVIDGAGRFGQGKMGDICGNPYAQTDPDRDECLTVTIGKEFGAIDIQELLVVFLNKFGGPIVVIPKDPCPLPCPGPK